MAQPHYESPDVGVRRARRIPSALRLNRRGWPRAASY